MGGTPERKERGEGRCFCTAIPPLAIENGTLLKMAVTEW